VGGLTVGPPAGAWIGLSIGLVRGIWVGGLSVEPPAGAWIGLSVGLAKGV
jgi:hypothetical protein